MEILSLLILLAVSIWVYKDAIVHGYSSGSALLWSLGVFFMLIVFLPIYLITRNSKRRTTNHYYDYQQEGPIKVGESSTSSEQIYCFHCGSEVSSKFVHCPYCGSKLKDADRKCQNCGEKLEAGWKVCPKCGAEQI